MCWKEGSLCRRTPNDERPLDNIHSAEYRQNLLLAKLLKATRWQNMPNYNRLVFIWHVGSKLMMLRTMCKCARWNWRIFFRAGKQDRALSDWEAYLYQLSPSPQRVLAGGSDSSDAIWNIDHKKNKKIFITMHRLWLFIILQLDLDRYIFQDSFQLCCWHVLSFYIKPSKGNHRQVCFHDWPLCIFYMLKWNILGNAR